MTKNGAVFLYMALLSHMDIKEKKIPAVAALAGVVCAFIFFGIQEGMEKKALMICLADFMLHIGPGLLMLLVALTTGKAGSGDGLVLMAVGLLYPVKMVVLLWGLSLWMLSLLSGVLLALHKIGKNSKLPYIPFLTIGFLMACGMEVAE